jgi:hypothetical protein
VDMIFKVIVAFCIGIAGMWGLGAYGMYWGREAARQSASLPRPEVKPFKVPDTSKLITTLHPKLDPNIGKNIPMGRINQQINQHIYAGKMVPLPPARIPGVRR